MVLFTLAGLAAQQFLSYGPGLIAGLLTGFVVAALIPAGGGACSVAPRAEPSDATRDS